MTKKKAVTQEQIEQMTLEQGIQISQVLDMPGWKVIENIILLTKSNAESERKLKLKSDSRGDFALYYSGVVDGAENVRINVYDAIEQARQIVARRQDETNEAE